MSSRMSATAVLTVTDERHERYLTILPVMLRSPIDFCIILETTKRVV